MTVLTLYAFFILPVIVVAIGGLAAWAHDRSIPRSPDDHRRAAAE